MSRKKLFLSLFKKLSIERLAYIDSTIEEDNKIPSIEEMNDSINSSIVDNELYSSKYDYFIQIEKYIEKNYDFVYKLEEKAQTISKSTWFKVGDNDEDTDFYEYCIPTRKHKTILSIIWED